MLFLRSEMRLDSAVKHQKAIVSSAPCWGHLDIPKTFAFRPRAAVSGCLHQGAFALRRVQSLPGSAGVNPEAKETGNGVVAKGRRVTFWLQSVSRTEGCRRASSGYAVSSTGVKLVDVRNPLRGLPTVASNMVKAADACTIARCWRLNDRATDGQAKLRRVRIFGFALAEFLARTPKLLLGRLEQRFAD